MLAISVREAIRDAVAAFGSGRREVALASPATSEAQVMTVKIADDLLGSRGGDWGILATAAFVSIAVPVLVFFTLQRFLVRGLEPSAYTVVIAGPKQPSVMQVFVDPGVTTEISFTVIE